RQISPSSSRCRRCYRRQHTRQNDECGSTKHLERVNAGRRPSRAAQQGGSDQSGRNCGENQSDATAERCKYHTLRGDLSREVSARSAERNSERNLSTTTYIARQVETR